MKITKQDLERIECKIDNNNTIVKGTEKFLKMSVFDYIKNKESFKNILTDSDYEFLYNIKTGNLTVYKTKEELDKLYRLSLSFFKLIPQTHRKSLLQGEFLSVDLNSMAFLSALIYAEKTIANF
tara:strand:- start:668 stop:1039 length:372 start_codon:yes stop_codon:yes gene_type:complete